jgi:hypothetical protein
MSSNGSSAAPPARATPSPGRVTPTPTASPSATAAPSEEKWHEPGEDGAREAKRETIIEAHESLAAVNPENAVRFKDVLEFLEQKTPEGQGRP